jgi:hypothetical protein
MIRYLTERIPVMTGPKWVFTRAQPIAIQDVIAYLTAVLETPESWGQVIEIGGKDILSYGEMMIGYAKVRGLKRILIPIPVLSPRLSSYWVHWMTPISAAITRPLIEGLRNEVIVRDDLARRIFPNITPMDYLTAVKKALENLEPEHFQTQWTNDLASGQGERPSLLFTIKEGMIIEKWQVEVQNEAKRVFSLFSQLGGENGWLYHDWAWRLRGTLDRLVGGVGMRQSPITRDNLQVGDTMDFWRVEAVDPGTLLRLRAEMKFPGKAWLQLEAHPIADDLTLLIQKSYFAPKGLLGLLYHYALYPFHRLIFSGLIQKLKALAES